MTKRDIVLAIAEDMQDLKQKDIAKVVQQALDIIKDEISHGRSLELRNFGVFQVVKRKARVGRNPNNPTETYDIPERLAVKFKLSKKVQGSLKDIS